MRVLLPMHRSRGNVEVMIGLGVQVLPLGAEAQVSVPDFPSCWPPLAPIGGGR